MRCMQDTKRAYAERHGYAFFDEAGIPPFKWDMLPMYKHMAHVSGQFRKLQYLLYLMHAHPGIEWFLWLDGDAMVTNPNVTVEARLQALGTMFRIGGNFVPERNMHLVIATDITVWNSGVFLIRNTLLGQHMLHLAWGTAASGPGADDQQSLIKALTAAERSNPLLKHVCSLRVKDMPLLQSYHEDKLEELYAEPFKTGFMKGYGPPPWQPDHWVLHLVNWHWTRRAQLLAKYGMCNATSSSFIG
ncbi:hypothetical protein FOA52_010800 [Chlamydomonas sp. UWO 241]|nr:hypothetical protein FOA52_010800 [Chlamydomonas sp. UWO 241]